MFLKDWGYVYQEEASPDGGDGGGGGENTQTISVTDFFSAVSDEGLRNEAAQMFTEKTPDDFIKTAINAQRALGSSIRIPGDDATEEALEKFYSKLQGVKGIVVNKDDESLRKSLGVPEDPNDYNIDLSALPEEIKIDQSELDAKRAQWHKLGYTQKQVEQATQDWIEEERQSHEEWQKTNAEAEKALRAEFGAAFDEKMELVNFVGKNVMSGEDMDYLRASGALLRPGVIKAFAKLGEQMSKDGSIEAARKNTNNYTPNEARARIAEIQSNPAYWDKTQPEHNALVAKAQSLYEMANQS